MSIASASHTALVRMVVLNDEPIGYAHAVDLVDRSLPPAMWTAEAFIGAMTHRGRGLGAEALGLLRDEVFRTTLAAGLAVRVSIRNERHVRAIERVGFLWRSVVPDTLLGPCWLMVAERR